MLKLISMIGSIIDKAQRDHVTAFSAQAAFFTILSFFPFMIVLLSLTKYFPITPNDMIDLVSTYLPPKYSGMVVPIIRSLNGKLTTTYMSITILTLLWSASKGILSMMTGLNTIHEQMLKMMQVMQAMNDSGAPAPPPDYEPRQSHNPNSMNNYTQQVQNPKNSQTHQTSAHKDLYSSVMDILNSQ